jgi:hypothetical protein
MAQKAGDQYRPPPPKHMNPSIPTAPCVVCGIKTNETQSVIGIAHYKCFLKQKKTPLIKAGSNTQQENKHDDTRARSNNCQFN